MARVQEKTAAERLSDLSRCLDTARGFGLRVDPSSLRDVLQDFVFSLDSHDEPGPEHVNPRKREQEKEKDSEASETDPPDQVQSVFFFLPSVPADPLLQLHCPSLFPFPSSEGSHVPGLVHHVTQSPD